MPVNGHMMSSLTRRLRLTVLMIALAPTLAWAADCNDCRNDFKDEVTNYCGVIPCARQAQSCVDDANSHAKDCSDECAKHRKAGRCTLLLECLSTCEDQRHTRVAQCTSHCAVGRQCTALVGALRRRCLRDCGGNKAGVAGPVAHANACQTSCVESIVGDCYDDCRDRCDGNAMAQKFCFEACRDRQCPRLKAECAGDSDAAIGCCAGNEFGCSSDEFDEDGAFQCGVSSK